MHIEKCYFRLLFRVRLTVKVLIGSQTFLLVVFEPSKFSFKTVGLKIEIHEIHQNLRNPVSILIKFHPGVTKYRTAPKYMLGF